MIHVGRLLMLMLLSLHLLSCSNDDKITALLNSSQKDDLIEGAYLAGESGKHKFVPLLVKDMADVRTSTNLKFKGYNVYQEKVIALGKIFDKKPSTAVTDKPDSSVIKFYIELSQKPQ